MYNKKSIDADLDLAEREQELPKEIQEKRKKGLLRTGYTTGTCASAATKAALNTLINKTVLDRVFVTLPKGRIISIKIAWTKKNIDQSSVTSAVIKDGGDDPDVTHGSEICSTVSLLKEKGKILIDGGIGVGRVTRPGLGLDVGSAAINSVPKKMIRLSIIQTGYKILIKKGIKAEISVPNGKNLAIKTDNPRLGIINGISILGTTGIVFPYSTASFAASIRQSLDVAVSLGTDTVALTTGGRSEDLVRSLYGKKIPEYCFIQMGDFSGYSIKQCALRSINKVIIGGFIGKLTKIAMGVKQTHVRGSHVNMNFLADIASQCTSSSILLDEIRNANTARHVSEIIDRNNVPDFYNLLCKKAHSQMLATSNKSINIIILLFGFDGSLLGKFPNKTKI